MSNTIPTRIADFLKNLPPFQWMKEEYLAALSSRVVVRYLREGDAVFRQGDPAGNFFYVVRQGAVKVFRETDDQRILVDQCGEGDAFGIQATDAEDYPYTAAAAEETLIYGIPLKGVQDLPEADPKLAFFLNSAYATGSGVSHSPGFGGKVFPEREAFIDRESPLFEILSIEHSKEPVTCEAGLPVREAARVMNRAEVGSIIIVNELRHPVGIVTDKDLRRRVATGQVSVEESVAAVMSKPVITLPPRVSVADVQMAMARHRIHHLCLTEDGTDQTPVVGVISEHDILVLQGNNPAILIREIRRCQTGAGLKTIRERAEQLLLKYIHQEVSIAFAASVMTEINDALLVRAIDLGLEAVRNEGATSPAAGFCWLALGSGGRGEQLLRTDQDSALVFEDVPPEEREAVRSFYLNLAGKVSALMRECGFEYCPAGMMASNPKWCLSLQEWKNQFGRWIVEPTPEAVMHCTVFFDFRSVYGQPEYAAQLSAFIFEALENQAVFLSHLAKNALENPPPLTFFRNFMLEKNGENKDDFDIKARAMMPLADAARVLAFDARLRGDKNTFRRFFRLAEIEPQNRELYEQAAEAYEILMRFRTFQGLKNGNSGRYFNPSELSKMQRITLRNAFRPVRELQSLLSVRFQTAFFS